MKVNDTVSIGGRTVHGKDIFFKVMVTAITPGVHGGIEEIKTETFGLIGKKKYKAILTGDNTYTVLVFVPGRVKAGYWKTYIMQNAEIN